MIIKEVKSKNIKSSGYDAEKKIMRIDFNSGVSYMNFNVDQNVIDCRSSYDSVNSWFLEKVKNNTSIRCERL